MSTAATSAAALAADGATALAFDAPVRRRSAPSPEAKPRRRRITGTTTEPLPVRACSGEDLGRHTQGRVAEGRRAQAPGEGQSTVHARHGVASLQARSAAPRLQRQELAAPALRLTRRGRMLVSALSVIVFGSAIVVLGLRITGVLQPGPDFTHTVPVQVAPGQSLWSIAKDTNPGQDPSLVVEKIADLNKLSTAADVVPGQTLQIPIAR